MSGTTDPWAEFRAAPGGDGDPWAEFRAAPQPSSPLRAIDDVVRQFAKGATFNFADEFAAGANALTGAVTGQPGTIGERYDANLAAERARDKSYEAANPIGSIALQVGGALANPITRIAGGGSLPAKMLFSGLSGAGLGGLAGFGEGEGGLMGRLGPAITGAATGGALGVAIPPIATALAKGARTVGGWMGLNNAKTDAQRGIVEALKADTAAGGDDIAEIGRKLQAVPADQPMILADMGGGATQGLSQAVSREPGLGRATAKATLDARGGINQSDRLTGAVKRGISADDFLGTKEDLLKTRSTAAKPKYEAAFTRIVPTADEAARVERFIKDPIGQDALQKGLRVIELENLADDIPFNPKAYGVIKGEDGKFILEPDRVPTLRLLDAVKRGYDEIVEEFRNDYGVLQLNQYGRAVNNARAVYRNSLGEMYPRYDAALKAWSGPSEALDAMNLGRRILTGDADTTAQVIAKMSPSEKDMFRVGVSRALIDKVKSAGDTLDLSKTKSIWGSQATRERVAAAFDDPKAFDDFSVYMTNEMDIAKTNNIINPAANSPTASIQAQRSQPAPAGPMLSALVSALRGDSLGAGANVLRSVNAMAPDVTKTYAEMAPYLFSMKAGDRSRLIGELLARETTDEGRRALSNALANAMLKGGAMTGVQVQN